MLQDKFYSFQNKESARSDHREGCYDQGSSPAIQKRACQTGHTFCHAALKIPDVNIQHQLWWFGPAVSWPGTQQFAHYGRT